MVHQAEISILEASLQSTSPLSLPLSFSPIGISSFSIFKSISISFSVVRTFYIYLHININICTYVHMLYTNKYINIRTYVHMLYTNTYISLGNYVQHVYEFPSYYFIQLSLRLSPLYPSNSSRWHMGQLEYYCTQDS